MDPVGDIPGDVLAVARASRPEFPDVLVLGWNPLAWPRRLRSHHEQLVDAYVRQRIDVYEQTAYPTPGGEDGSDLRRAAVEESLWLAKRAECRSHVAFDLLRWTQDRLLLAGVIVLLYLAVRAIGELGWLSAAGLLLASLGLWLVAVWVADRAMVHEVRWAAVRTCGLTVLAFWVAALGAAGLQPYVRWLGHPWVEELLMTSAWAVGVTVGGITLATGLFLVYNAAVFRRKDQRLPEDALIDNLVWLLWNAQVRLRDWQEARTGGRAHSMLRDTTFRARFARDAEYVARAFEQYWPKALHTGSPGLDESVDARARFVGAAIREAAQPVLFDESCLDDAVSRLSFLLSVTAAGEWAAVPDPGAEQAQRDPRPSRWMVVFRTSLPILVGLVLVGLPLSGLVRFTETFSAPLTLLGLSMVIVPVLDLVDPKASERLDKGIGLLEKLHPKR